MARFIPLNLRCCCKCGEELFSYTEDMIAQFGGYDVGIFYRDYEDCKDDGSKILTCEEFLNEQHEMYEDIFSEVFGENNEIAYINKHTCPYCNHHNEWHSFYINKEFIVNQR